MQIHRVCRYARRGVIKIKAVSRVHALIATCASDNERAEYASLDEERQEGEGLCSLAPTRKSQMAKGERCSDSESA